MRKIVELPKPKTVKCKACKTKFSYEAADITTSAYYVYVKCPVCYDLKRIGRL